MKLAAPWYVQGGQMGENVAAAALRRPGSEMSHIFGWGVVGYDLAMARDAVKVAELAEQAERAAWSAVYSWAGGHGGAGRLLLPGRLEECGRASNVMLKRYQSCRLS
jgi:hypothetical protein